MAENTCQDINLKLPKITGGHCLSGAPDFSTGSIIRPSGDVTNKRSGESGNYRENLSGLITHGIQVLPSPCVSTHVVQSLMGAPAQQFVRQCRIRPTSRYIARPAANNLERHLLPGYTFE
jgi:hypothetical protein